MEAGNIIPGFVELPVPVTEGVNEAATVKPDTAAILKGSNQMILEITNQASSSFLTSLFRAMNDAE